MWTIAAANKKFQGPLGSYNGLTDIHLAHYFSSPAKLSHLKEANLITAAGTIIPEQIYKVETLKYDKKKHLYDFLAKNIIQNAACEESCWSKKLLNYLEDISKMQVVEHLKRVGQKKLDKNLSRSLNKIRATVAPSHLSRIKDNTRSKHRKTKVFQLSRSAMSSAEYSLRNGNFQQPNISKLKRCCSAKDWSPYTFPMLWCSVKNQVPLSIHNHVNFSKRKERKLVQSSVDSDLKSLNCTNKVFPSFKNVNSDRCLVTLYYHGHGFVNFQNYYRKEIVIKQQHCGGSSVTAYKGDIAPNETITFPSLTHDGYSFSVTIFLDGIRDLKLSSCCVFRYTLRRRIGGSNGNFSIENITGGKKCLKCQYLEVITSNSTLKKELVTSENIKETDCRTDGVIQKENSIDQGLKNTLDVVPDDENSSSEVDGSNASIKSEASTKLDEDIEEHLSTKSDLQNSESEAQILDEHDVKKNDMNAVGESNSESSIISIEESVYDDMKQEMFKSNNYQSESSSEEENGKKHVILASVHN